MFLTVMILKKSRGLLNKIGIIDVMEYEVNSEFSYDFENVKKIIIGSGRLYYVYRDDIPYVSVEVNLLDCSEHLPYDINADKLCTEFGM